MRIRRQTFTLIEMLAVVVLIFLLSGLIIGGAKFAYEKSQQSAIMMEMKTLEMALQEYKKDWGHYPVWTDKKLLEGSGTKGDAVVTVSDTPVPDDQFDKDTGYPGATSFTSALWGSVQGDAWNLDFSLNAPSSKSGKPYLKNRSTTPFTQKEGTRAVRYRYPGVKNPQKYDLIFPGHDEKFGTDDDIKNW